LTCGRDVLERSAPVPIRGQGACFTLSGAGGR